MDITTINEIIKSVEEHGLSLVLLIGIIVFWFVPWVQRLSKKEQSQLDSDNEYEATLKKRKISQMITEKTFKIDAEINLTLSEMLLSYGAQWVTLWQFHNGVNSLAGVPFLKISATHERTSPNVMAKAYLYKDLPVSLFADNNTYIAEKEVITLTNCDGNVNSAIRNMMNTSNIKKTYMGVVRGANGGLIGIITMSFLEDTWVSDSDFNNIRSYTSRVAIALSNLVFVNDESKRISYDE